MTREEMIEMAALRIYPDDQAARLVFMAGAMFADNHPDVYSLWHDAKEMPKYGSAYIAIDNNNSVCDCNSESLIISQTVWNDLLSVRNIYKWIYIADILPKGGEG